jgi:H+/Cl- antiporter ClcA
MKQPSFTDTLRKELSDWRVWVTRGLVIAAAAAAGLGIVGFTWLTERALALFFALHAAAWWSPLLWTPACTAAIVWATRRFAPGAAGSGIPQVMAALEPPVGEDQRPLFVSARLAVAKIGLVAAGLLGGLSLGREGPAVQIAAGLMHAVRRWLPPSSAVSDHSLLVAGAAAGVAAAFNTPLAGVMFAIEALARSPEQRNSGLIVAGIVLAGLIAISVHGNGTYFGVIRVPAIGWTLLLPGLLVALASGLLGGLFARLLIASVSGASNDRFTRWRARRPVAFGAGCGFAVALIGIATQGATFGGGYDFTRQLLEGGGSATTLEVLLKMGATWLTTWSGVPGGIFAPALAIGGALGSNISALLGYPHAPTLIALGMTGFLAAATQAPLTAFIIVMEMVDGHGMVLSLMGCALVASGVSRLISRPLYASLAEVQLGRLPRQPEAGATG